MAQRLLRACSVIANSLQNVSARNTVITASLLKPKFLLVQNARYTSFFNKRPAEQLWKGVTSVSNAGRRRGRGKGAPRKKDLNRGQVIGVGKVHVTFPGLNAPVYYGQKVAEQRVISRTAPNEMREKLVKIQAAVTTRKRTPLHPLERGWTGAHLGGTKIGPPDAIAEESFEGFESWVLESKIVSLVTGNVGRVRESRAFVVTGNGNGLIGIAQGRGPLHNSAVKTAKNRAGQKLMFIERYEEHTVLHDFFSQFGNSKVYVKKMPPGYGLVCHRALKACCEAVGIKDIYAKVEGSTHVKNCVKAFLLGLLRQKTYQKMADEKKLHVVEFKKERGYFPIVLASPAEVRKPEEIPPTENLDFNHYILDGKLRLEKKKPAPFYTKLPSWQTRLRKLERWRGQDKVRIQLKAEYGDVRSFLAEKYPECVKRITIKKIMEKYKPAEAEESASA